MSKLLDLPVIIEDDHMPMVFFWRGHRYNIIEITDQWWDTGRWWQNEPEKFFIRAATSDNSVVELYQQKDKWMLYKIYD
ncbi:DUF6504 family protein [Metallumcola ferriviriculae]|uniref:DUF6504 family protein n=1 Tax=Metallumcola ferriviriculae TaxID=3039180 RepID=A0AAU0UPZ4_9FIRM|nr:DUF6504 family protein [Desulfitibacteraceae bacterium MK1]